MSLEIPYRYAQEHLAEVLDQVENSHEVAVIHRQGHKDVAVISADDLATLHQAAHPALAQGRVPAADRDPPGSTPERPGARIR